ncbi:MAG: Hypothetical protein AJITA_00779 [Acetilactobacillus jinshanensis]
MLNHRQNLFEILKLEVFIMAFYQMGYASIIWYMWAFSWIKSIRVNG